MCQVVFKCDTEVDLGLREGNEKRIGYKKGVDDVLYSCTVCKAKKGGSS